MNSTHTSESNFDVLIIGGRIFDGTGAPWFRADLGIEGDRITAIGHLEFARAKVRLDATEKVVSPGFVDAHVHGDLPLFLDPYHEPAIRQGVTSYILGQDGVAMAPAKVSTFEYMCNYTAGFSAGKIWLEGDNRPTWTSMEDYLSALDRKSALNVGCLVPNGNLRMETLGLETRAPSSNELDRMKGLLREAMEEGAVGLSTGMDYIPSLYAEVEELADLCRVMAPFGGVYVTHQRRYDPEGVLTSMDEVYQIGRDGDVPVHISHFNSRADIVIPKLNEGRELGIDVTFDLYCYLFGSTILAMMALPPWIQEGGLDATLDRLRDPQQRQKLVEFSPRVPLDQLRLSYIAATEYQSLEGKTLAEAARISHGGDSPEQIVAFVCDMLIASDMVAGCVQPHRNRSEKDIEALMNHPAMMGGSDGIYTGSHPHPRGFGCYARYLGYYVRDAKTWSLETAVHRLAAHPARRFGLRDRGLLREGMYADVVVFDPKTIEDKATFEEGKQFAVGMEHVLVNGELVLHAGVRTDALPGRGLRFNK